MKSKLIVLAMALLSVITVNAQKESLYQKQEYIKGEDTLLYRIMFPKHFSEARQYPLLLFLHGSGERGNDNEKQLVHGSKLFANEMVRDSFPAIVIFPQCPEQDYWSDVEVDRSSMPLGLKFQNKGTPTKALQLVIDLMKEYIGKDYVKSDQVYVMGLSMGGMGTFEIIYRQPDMFAAAIPICGGGDPETTASYAKKIPLWVFHGAQDNVVDPQFSIDMVSAILKEGGYPRFTLFDFANHNSWDATFAEPELLKWLFSHHKTSGQ
ncbi:MAG: prolyl oligopeptidase family serine peptidase [Flavobacteriaceae bacterium]|nr:prolyl oligopeptidase family serine peptidase [Flavobacteriaceae bacterium]